MHGCACKQYIFRFFNTSTFTAMCFDENPFTCQCEKTKTKKGLRVSNFPLLLDVFKWHRGREGVNTPRWSVYADEQHGTRQRRALWQLVRKVRRRCRPLRLERKFGHLGRVLKEAQRGQVRPMLDIRCCSDDV